MRVLVCWIDFREFYLLDYEIFGLCFRVHGLAKTACEAQGTFYGSELMVGLIGEKVHGNPEPLVLM